MNTKTFIAAALASVFAITAAAPVFAAQDTVKHEKRMHRLMKRVDTNHDGKISPAEMQSALSRSFDLLDTNHDGILTKAEIDNRKSVYKAYHKQARAERKAGQHVAGIIRMPKGVEKHFARLDANHDGVLSKAELSHVAQHVFKRRDHDKDGYISAADLKA